MKTIKDIGHLQFSNMAVSNEINKNQSSGNAIIYQVADYGRLIDKIKKGISKSKFICKYIPSFYLRKKFYGKEGRAVVKINVNPSEIYSRMEGHIPTIKFTSKDIVAYKGKSAYIDLVQFNSNFFKNTPNVVAEAADLSGSTEVSKMYFKLLFQYLSDLSGYNKYMIFDMKNTKLDYTNLPSISRGAIKESYTPDDLLMQIIKYDFDKLDVVNMFKGYVIVFEGGNGLFKFIADDYISELNGDNKAHGKLLAIMTKLMSKVDFKAEAEEVVSEEPKKEEPKKELSDEAKKEAPKEEVKKEGENMTKKTESVMINEPVVMGFLFGSYLNHDEYGFYKENILFNQHEVDDVNI